MARYLNNQKYQRRYLGSTKLKKRFLDETNVWSGGSVVSYFDGETLLGTREVDEGSDVLHNTGFTPTKTDYTFVGWANEPNGTRFETLVATGNSMNLYALFAPNTLVVAQGSMIPAYNSAAHGWNFSYTSESVNSNHVTGEVVSGVASTYQALTYTATFNLNKRYYQTADLQLLFGNDGINIATCAFDETQLSHGAGASVETKAFNNISDGNHTITSAIFPSGNLAACTIGIGTLTLSNPIQWV